MSNLYDFIVIGGGSAGYAAARTARDYTDSVAIIEGAQALGGLCILRGCMPSKTLIYSAEVLHLAKQAKHFGLNIPEAHTDMPALHERKVRTIQEFAEYRAEQLSSDRFDLYRSHAQFVSSDTLALQDGTVLKGKNIFISTGSTIHTPNLPGLNTVAALTSDDVLDLDTLPESVIVLGGGVIACELAQFLHRAGSKVTQIQRSPQLLKTQPTQSAAVLETALRDEGIELWTNTQIQALEPTSMGIKITFTHQNQSITREATHLLNALGRKPNTDNLNLDKAGVTLNTSGHINTNEYQQSSQSHIYAGGDCAGPHEIVHTAILQGECAAHHALGQAATPIDYKDLTKIVFTDPQIAQVGLSEKALKENSVDYITADYPFDDHGKSILMEAKYGYVKLYADKTSGQILAAECVSKDASELIHSMAVAITLNATAQDLLKVHWYHPTLSEIWSYPLETIADTITSS